MFILTAYGKRIGGHGKWFACYNIADAHSYIAYAHSCKFFKDFRELRKWAVAHNINLTDIERTDIYK